MITALIRKERENPYAGLPLPDTVREQTKKDSELSDVIGEYAKIIETGWKKNLNNRDEKKDMVHKPIRPLSSDKINKFIKNTRYFKDFDHNYMELTGRFISRLIQSSYNANNNDFDIRLDPDVSWEYIAANLKGEKDNPIRINIFGDLGDDLGYNAKYVDIKLEGSAGAGVGVWSENSKFDVLGDVNAFLGAYAKKSRFVIHGNSTYKGRENYSMKFILGCSRRDNDCEEYGAAESAEDCTFLFHGNYKNSYINRRGRRNRFFTKNKDDYDKFKGQIKRCPFTDHTLPFKMHFGFDDCSVGLIDKEGNILKEKKKQFGIWNKVLW